MQRTQWWIQYIWYCWITNTDLFSDVKQAWKSVSQRISNTMSCKTKNSSHQGFGKTTTKESRFTPLSKISRSDSAWKDYSDWTGCFCETLASNNCHWNWIAVFCLLVKKGFLLDPPCYTWKRLSIAELCPQQSLPLFLLILLELCSHCFILQVQIFSLLVISVCRLLKAI